METQNMEIAQICEQGSLGNNPRQPRQKAEADSAKKQANNIDNNKERKKFFLKKTENTHTTCIHCVTPSAPRKRENKV